MDKPEIKEEKIEYNSDRISIKKKTENHSFAGSMIIMSHWMDSRITIDLPQNNQGNPLIFRPEYEIYIIGDSVFNKEDWEKIVNKELGLKEIIEIENIEQRMEVLAYYGIEWLLKESDAILIDKSERGNELYQILGVFRRPAYFLKYKDISTDRWYFSGVDPSSIERVEKNKMADNAMAWKFQWEFKEYQQLNQENEG